MKFYPQGYKSGYENHSRLQQQTVLMLMSAHPEDEKFLCLSDLWNRNKTKKGKRAAENKDHG